jgi:hypothetical protein
MEDSMRVVPAAALAATFVLFAATADAQLRREYMHDNHGPEAALDMGVAGFTNDSSTAFTSFQRASDHLYWPGFVASLELDGRITPWLALGARIQWMGAAARDLPSITTGGMLNVLNGGPFARLYIGPMAHWQHLDPWFQLGI